MALLEIHDLNVEVDGKMILNGITLSIGAGEVHALMGPNGSGKSTLANTLMGHPKYKITSGTITLDGKDLSTMAPNERAREGLFLSFQHPAEIPGVTVESFLRMAYNTTKGLNLDVIVFHGLLKERMAALQIDEKFSRRYLNDGFSGGEKKRMEMLQMIVLEPRIIILDETDSGLDVDALRVVASSIQKMRGPNTGILIITHFNRILRMVEPDKVHIITGGKIIKSADSSLAHEIERSGYGQHAPQ